MLVQRPRLQALHSSRSCGDQMVDLQEMRVQEVTKYIIAYPQALILYDTLDEAKAARTSKQRKADMELWRVEFDRFLPEEKETA